MEIISDIYGVQTIYVIELQVKSLEQCKLESIVLEHGVYLDWSLT